ncbi:tetratricopeptide repeat protein [Allosphingosinicella indica]|uniref:TolA-binding protein n=1 Tax=Allosphingosinicella indica TaxID=941907 RepID=A0A1X7GTD2_9SPHN|nr:tetratricopeptide repeat protein [Allosphingosinicella indica]SMF74192.1 TolA-binding protein [Allosphingosinicella indica]
MRFLILSALLLAGTATPAMAQQQIDRRIGKLEDEMRAVQRRVFQGARPDLQPEISAPQSGGGIGGIPSQSAVSDLTSRVDALENQLRQLTGQAEENNFRLRQLEQDFQRLRDQTQSTLQQVRTPAPAPAPIAAPSTPTPTPSASETPAPAASTGDAGEDAYNAGYRLWSEGRFGEAQRALEAMAKKYPKHAKASWARNLAGRAYLDDGKPATAAKTLLANYQTDPKGERAPDSLYFLGQALVQLKKPADACKVYDELQDVYGANMRAFLRERLPKARTDAKCS